MNRTQIINHLIKIYGHKSYLEIGVDHPELNFNKIICKEKIGVDPNPKARATKVMTSDEFFQSNTRKFDCIFIDGLHHAEQVEKDIFNSLECLSEGGTIICHDMNPTTKEMQSVPREQGIWTGDCWRAWLKYRDEKYLSMHVLDADYGVGVIRRGIQKPLNLPGTINQYETWAGSKVILSNIIPVDLDPVSICIPAFEQYGHGAKTLTNLLGSIRNLKGKFEVIVSDNSEDDKLEKICDTFKKYLDLSYYRNPDKGISTNTNFAVSKAKYDLIKPMYQDDTFLHPSAIEYIAFALKFDHWVACSGSSLNQRGEPIRPRNPEYTEGIITGKNSLGMPSVIAYRKTDIKFDPELKTLLDCLFYHQMFERYGAPGYIKQNLIGSRYWEGSTSRRQGNLTEQELPILREKYGIEV